MKEIQCHLWLRGTVLLAFLANCSGNHQSSNPDGGVVDSGQADGGADAGGDDDTDSDGDSDGEECTYCFEFELEACDENNPAVKIVDAGEALSDLIADEQYRIYCLRPGAYRGMTITRRAPADAPVLIRPLEEDRLRPWDFAPEEVPSIGAAGDSSSSVRTSFEGAQNIIVTGIRFFPGRIRVTESEVDNEPSRTIVLDSVLVEGTYESSGTQIYVPRAESIWIQNSVLRETNRLQRDVHCIGLTGRVADATITRNEIYNCAGDGVQLISDEGGGSVISGTKIVENHIYQTPDFHFEVETPDGTIICSYGENAIDIKATSADSTTIISGNIMNGFRPAVEGEFLAAAVTIHYIGSQNIVMNDNVMFDSGGGIALGASPGNCMHFHNNLIHDILSMGIWLHADSEVNLFTHNTISVGELHSTYEGATISRRDTLDSMFANNLFVGPLHSSFSPLLPDSFAVFYNTFINYEPTHVFSNQSPSNNQEFSGVIRDEWFDDHCFKIQPLTAPKTFCLPAVVPNATSVLGGTANKDILDLHPAGIDFFNKCPMLSADYEGLTTPGFIEAVP